MHKLVSNGILTECPNNLKVIKYFDPVCCHNPSLNNPTFVPSLTEVGELRYMVLACFLNGHSLNIKITTLRYANFPKKKNNSRFIAVLR